MPQSTYIHFPPFFAFEMPPWGPLELWLQHTDCGAPATKAEVEVVAPGKVLLTRGWGEVARVCRTGGALVIHFEYNGASLMLFKVFDAEGRRLECYPRGSSRDVDVARARPATRFPSSGDSWESKDSPQPLVTPETSDDSYVPPSSRRARSKAAASGRRRG